MAKKVLSVTKWLEVGRRVKQDVLEKAYTGESDENSGPISIIVPRTGKGPSKKEKERMTPEEREAAEKGRRVYFVPGVVWDYHDTEGIPGWKDPKTGSAPYEHKSWRQDPNDDIEQITALVNAGVNWATTNKKIEVDLEKVLGGDAGGYSTGGQVVVNSTYRGINQFSTLVHEFAHELLHWDKKKISPEDTKLLEVDAESVAFIVLGHYGFETKDSPNYIALWRGTGKDVRDRQANISKATKEIIEGIEGSMRGIEMDEDKLIEARSLRRWVLAHCGFVRGS
jgi:hypothetical protein